MTAEPHPFVAALDAAIEQVHHDLHTLGVCADCLLPARIPCPDGEPRCYGHARRLAQGIMVVKTRSRHCTTPAQRKARAKRRRKAKAAR